MNFSCSHDQFKQRLKLFPFPPSFFHFQNRFFGFYVLNNLFSFFFVNFGCNYSPFWNLAFVSCAEYGGGSVSFVLLQTFIILLMPFWSCIILEKFPGTSALTENFERNLGICMHSVCHTNQVYGPTQQRFNKSDISPCSVRSQVL